MLFGFKINFPGGLQKGGVIKIHTFLIEANQDIFLACLWSLGTLASYHEISLNDHLLLSTSFWRKFHKMDYKREVQEI